MTNTKYIHDDSEQIRWLRRFADLICHKLEHEIMTETEAVNFLLEARHQVMTRYPEKQDEYINTYERRFKRILIRNGIAITLFSDEKYEC